jgi:hypothetical protein
MTLIDKTKQVVEYIQGVNGKPYFHPGYWFDAAQKLSESNLDPLLQGGLYELVFLNVDFEEIVNTETNEVKPTPFNLFVINRVDEKNLSVEEQHEQEFPGLRTIEQNLLNAYKRKGCKFTLYRRKEYFFRKTEKSKLNNDIYIIQMTFSDFIYFKNCENG